MNGKVMPVRIVPMKTEHLDAVAELERSCFTVPWSRNALAEELDNALSAFLVALDENDRVVGYAGLQVVLDEGYITNVAVRPDCRRRGVAGKLLDVFERFAEGNHLAFLSLEVRASNYAAIALYGQHGYPAGGRARRPPPSSPRRSSGTSPRFRSTAGAVSSSRRSCSGQAFRPRGTPSLPCSVSRPRRNLSRGLRRSFSPLPSCRASTTSSCTTTALAA